MHKILIFIFTFFTFSNVSAGTLGDVDNDDKIGLTEAVYALQVAAGIKIPPNIPSEKLDFQCVTAELVYKPGSSNKIQIV